MLMVLQGDALTELRKLPSESVHCCVTSPPYWGLRDYGISDQLGLEKTPEEYVAKMVEVFREVRRVLRTDGCLWLNLGDSYWTDSPVRSKASEAFSEKWDLAQTASRGGLRKSAAKNGVLKNKDLCGIPWRVAFALQADGWWLRSDIIWAKPNPMPESVTDRPTKIHEYLFLLTKSSNYFYDAEAIKERYAECTVSDSRVGIDVSRGGIKDYNGAGVQNPSDVRARIFNNLGSGRNKRSVWTVATAPYPEAHFATYPPDLIKPCILAGTSAKGCCAKCGSPWERIIEHGKPSFETTRGQQSWTAETGQRDNCGGLPLRESKTIGWRQSCDCSTTCPDCLNELSGDAMIDNEVHGRCHAVEPETQPCTVLDPFAGSGTTGQVALELGRKAILIELNPKYVELIRQRCNVTPGLALA